MNRRHAVAVVLAVAALSAILFVGGAPAETNTGEIGATIGTVFNVEMTGSPISFTIDADANPADVGSATGDDYVELTVQSNVTYTVNLACSGNLQLEGKADNGVNEIETEYAIWKNIEWHDWYTQQGGSPDTATGWVYSAKDEWINHADPYWFEAETGGGIQGGNSGTPENATTNLPFPTGYLAEHDDDYTWSLTWNPNWYNHGADLTLRFYPFLDVFEAYGTRAGTYVGTITMVVTSVDSSVP